MKEDKKNRVFLKILKCFVVLLLTVLAFVAVLATCSAKWALKTWNHLTADELVFHLRAPLEGTNQAMIDEFIKNCAVPAVVIAIVAAVLLVITGILKKKRLFWSISGIVLAASTVVSRMIIFRNLLHLHRKMKIFQALTKNSTAAMSFREPVLPWVPFLDRAAEFR